MNYDEQYLAHYGVKGMKWGVRRYQNYDGSYTKRGVNRFKQAEKQYESAKQLQKMAKAGRKKGGAITANGQRYATTRNTVKEANQYVKSSKKEMKKAYKNLKYDKLADEGKQLYKQGKRITFNNNMLGTSEAIVGIGSYAAYNIINSKTGDTRLARLSSVAIAAGGTAVNALLYAKSERENRRLRAYYSH